MTAIGTSSNNTPRFSAFCVPPAVRSTVPRPVGFSALLPSAPSRVTVFDPLIVASCEWRREPADTTVEMVLPAMTPGLSLSCMSRSPPRMPASVTLEIAAVPAGGNVSVGSLWSLVKLSTTSGVPPPSAAAGAAHVSAAAVARANAPRSRAPLDCACDRRSAGRAAVDAVNGG